MLACVAGVIGLRARRRRPFSLLMQSADVAGVKIALAVGGRGGGHRLALALLVGRCRSSSGSRRRSAIWQTASAYWVQKSAIVAGRPSRPPCSPREQQHNGRTAAPRNFNVFIASPPVSIKEPQFASARRAGQARIRTCSVWPWSRIATRRSASGRAKPALARQLLQPGERRVEPLVAEGERPVAGGDQEARPQIVEGVERVERRQVLLAERRRLVAGDRQERDVGVKAAADLGEAREVAGVAGEVGARRRRARRAPAPRSRRRRGGGSRRGRASPSGAPARRSPRRRRAGWLLPGSSSTMSAKPRPRTRLVQRGGTTSTALRAIRTMLARDR